MCTIIKTLVVTLCKDIQLSLIFAASTLSSSKLNKS